MNLRLPLILLWKPIENHRFWPILDPFPGPAPLPNSHLAEEAAAEAVVRVLQQHRIAGHQGGDSHPDHLPHGEVPGHNGQDQTCRREGHNVVPPNDS